MKDLMSSELSELMTTAEVASLLRVDPLDAEPLAQLGFGPARDVVIFLVTAVSARRRSRVAAPR